MKMMTNRNKTTPRPRPAPRSRPLTKDQINSKIQSFWLWMVKIDNEFLDDKLAMCKGYVRVIEGS